MTPIKKIPNIIIIIIPLLSHPKQRRLGGSPDVRAVRHPRRALARLGLGGAFADERRPSHERHAVAGRAGQAAPRRDRGAAEPSHPSGLAALPAQRQLCGFLFHVAGREWHIVALLFFCSVAVHALGGAHTCRAAFCFLHPTRSPRTQTNKKGFNTSAVLVWNAVGSGGVINAAAALDALPAAYTDVAFVQPLPPVAGFWVRDAACAKRCKLA